MLSKAVERGVLFVNLSGVGKSTLIEYVREHIPELGFSVFSRARRPGEVVARTIIFWMKPAFWKRNVMATF